MYQSSLDIRLLVVRSASREDLEMERSWNGLCASSLIFSSIWKEFSEISSLSYMTPLRLFSFSRQYCFDTRSSDADPKSSDANRVSRASTDHGSECSWGDQFAIGRGKKDQYGYAILIDGDNSMTIVMAIRRIVVTNIEEIFSIIFRLIEFPEIEHFVIR
jgi:hypothetical protein